MVLSPPFTDGLAEHDVHLGHAARDLRPDGDQAGGLQDAGRENRLLDAADRGELAAVEDRIGEGRAERPTDRGALGEVADLDAGGGDAAREGDARATVATRRRGNP